MVQLMMPPLRRKSEQVADIGQGACPTTSCHFLTATAYRSLSLDSSLVQCSALPIISLIARPNPVFQCCTLKNGRAWYAKSRDNLYHAPRGSEASASNYQVYLFFSNHTPFVPSSTTDFRQTTKWRQASLRTDIKIVDRKGSVYLLSTFCIGMMLLT